MIFLNSRDLEHAREHNYLMMKNIYFRLRGAILHQNIHDCVKLFRDRKLRLEGLLRLSKN